MHGPAPFRLTPLTFAPALLTTLHPRPEFHSIWYGMRAKYAVIGSFPRASSSYI